MTPARRLRWLLPVLALLASACQGAVQGPTNGGTLTVALGGDPATLNRFVAADTVSRRAVAPLFPMLYALNPDMSVVPDLASGFPTIADGGKRWTVALRHGAKWSDGKAITADDVLSTVSIQRNKNLVTGVLFDWDKLDHLDKVDDYTVRFTLTESYAPFLANSLVTFVAPAHVYGLIDPARMKEDPIGARPTVTGGPFKFDKRIAGQEVDLSANTDYYGGRPHFDRLVERIIPDASSAATSLLSAEVNWQPDAPHAEIKQLRGSGTFVRQYPDMGYYDVRFNDRPDHLFGDKRVRQAFAYAIDKEALVKDVTGGAGTVAWGDILPTSWAYDSDAAVRYRVNLDRARQLLTDAGWTPGADGILTRGGKRFSVDFYVRRDADVRNRAAAEIATKVKAIGMELKVSPADFDVFFDPLKQGKFDIALSGFATGPDPDDYYIFHSSQLRPEKNPSGVNWSGYSNPELDRLIDLERSTLASDPARTRSQRRRIFSQIEKILSDDVVTYFLWADNTVQGFDSRVGGVGSGTLVNVDYGRNVRTYADWYLKKP
ncbi:MAG TPA: ABC transporter substrate-binding protein [Candidatus Dormibacteraeota bacterium]|jgi:peptide/nickel transport system substrate-binding protein